MSERLYELAEMYGNNLYRIATRNNLNYNTITECTRRFKKAVNSNIEKYNIDDTHLLRSNFMSTQYDTYLHDGISFYFYGSSLKFDIVGGGIAMYLKLIDDLIGCGYEARNIDSRLHSIDGRYCCFNLVKEYPISEQQYEQLRGVNIKRATIKIVSVDNKRLLRLNLNDVFNISFNGYSIQVDVNKNRLSDICEAINLIPYGETFFNYGTVVDEIYEDVFKTLFFAFVKNNIYKAELSPEVTEDINQFNLFDQIALSSVSIQPREYVQPIPLI